MTTAIFPEVGRQWGSSTRYAVAALIFGIAVVLRLLLFPFDAGLVYLTFTPAMVICFYLCGNGPGAVMTITSALTGYFAFLPPFMSFDKPLSSGSVIIGFLVSAVVAGFVVQRMRTALSLAGANEEALRASEERYRTILRDQSELISRYKPDGTFSYANEAFCRFFGTTPEELTGNKWAPMAHPDDVAAIREQLATLSPANPIVEIENRVYNGNDELRWCRFINRAFFDAQGNLSEIQSVGRDITNQREAQEALRQSHEQFNRLVQRLPVGVFKILLRQSGDYRFIYASEKHASLLGTTTQAILANPEAAFGNVHPDDRPSLDAANWDAAHTGKPFLWEGRSIVNGAVRWFRIESNPTVLPNGDSVWDGIIADVTERKLLDEQFKHFAFHDALTGLPNRRLLHDRICQSLAAANRDGKLGALLYLDLDNFKPLNDHHGHEAGDLLLNEVARRLSGCVRAVDTVARVGGDEFVVLLGGLVGDRAQATDEAMKVAEKIRLAVAEPYTLAVRYQSGALADITHHCSASIGVAVYPDEDNNCDEILKLADTAMYLAKTEGRNRISLYARSLATVWPHAKA